MTNGINKNCNGYILAGGKSSRMGEDKGLMLFNGKPIVQYVIEALSPVANKVIIVSNNPDYKDFGYEVIEDAIKDIGPAGGIYSVLKHSDAILNFIVSCDMPFVKTKAVSYMLENVGNAGIVLPVHKGQMEPLFGLYRTECLKEWQRLVNDGVLTLHEMVKHFKLKKRIIENNDAFNENTFLNVNTRNEFESALKQKN